MTNKAHVYRTKIVWTGNAGTGTSGYRTYGREHTISAGGKPDILASSDPAFRGDPSCWNPEDLFLASIAACHQLWYLHLCAEAGVVVTAYEDSAEGFMDEEPDGAGQFSSIVLRPTVTIASGSDATMAVTLHDAAAQKCFLARSVKFPVTHEPVVQTTA